MTRLGREEKCAEPDTQATNYLIRLLRSSTNLPAALTGAWSLRCSCKQTWHNLFVSGGYDRDRKRPISPDPSGSRNEWSSLGPRSRAIDLEGSQQIAPLSRLRHLGDGCTAAVAIKRIEFGQGADSRNKAREAHRLATVRAGRRGLAFDDHAGTVTVWCRPALRQIKMHRKPFAAPIASAHFRRCAARLGLCRLRGDRFRSDCLSPAPDCPLGRHGARLKLRIGNGNFRAVRLECNNQIGQAILRRLIDRGLDWQSDTRRQKT